VAYLRVHLFGGFRLSAGDETIAALQAPRLQSLTAYLLLHRAAPQSRQQIAFRFWPETSDGQAQTNLRQLLHSLRQRLPNAGDYLRLDERTVQWRGDSDYTLDVADFETALLAAARRSGAAKIAALEEAASFYTGDLLPGNYDEWLLPLRERLAQRFVAGLEELVLLHEERRNYAAAITHAQRLLRYDPLHEATYRHLMRLCALTGDRAGALRVYHTCVAALERELGVPPSPATRELYEQLLSTHLPQAAPQGEYHTFVGRQDEWFALQSLWQRVNRGALAVACIAGEAGLGKTRLAEELLHWAEQQGIPVLSSRVYAAEGGLAYAPLVEWLRSPTLQPAIVRLAPVWRTELARLLPELLDGDPALPPPEPLTERWQRQRLFEAVERALITDDQPLILDLDDLHWCDDESLDWLLFAIHRHPQARLLLLATLRSDELASGGPVAAFLLELRRLDLLVELALPPLDGPETTALAESIAEQKLESVQADRLYAATEGNPLFVIETMRSQPNGAASFDSPLTLPPKVHGVIRARLAQLSPASRELIGLAAVIGRSFTADLLVAASEQTEETVVAGLDELWQRRIVRVQGVNGYDFSHERLCEVAYGEVPPARRRLLHRRVAVVLETMNPNPAGTLCVQLAHHYEQGGLVEQAVYYLQRAAESVRVLYAYREAIGYLERAIGLLHSQPAGAAALERELEVQMALCDDWAVINNHLGVEVEAAYQRALLLCRQLRLTPQLFTVYWGLHEIALYRGDYAESLELAQHCLQIAEEMDDVDLRLQAHHALWAPYHLLGQHTHSLAHIAAGLAIYQYPMHEALTPHYGWHDAVCCALGTSCEALWQSGLLDQTGQKQRDLIAHANRLEQPLNRADGFVGVALTFHLLRAPALAQPYAEMALRVGTEQGNSGMRVAAAVPLGWSLAVQGRTEEGLTLLEEGLEDRRKMGNQTHSSRNSVMLAEAYLAAGRPDAAITALEKGISNFALHRDLICAPDLWRLKGDALLALGGTDSEAEACYRAALSLAQELGAKVSGLRAATALARLYQRQGNSETGLATLQTIYDGFSEGFDTPDLLAAKLVLDELAVNPTR
jgi:DNA-binding SARP family transcriptional activator/tetratricopeptide (TPR) repeat protein